MRIGVDLVLTAALISVACTGSTASSPTSPSTPTMSGFWVGSSSDSTGSMMGAGLTAAMMNNTQWTVKQSGGTFSGTMQFSGYMGMGTTMTVSGTMTGHSGTFTMTLPSGSMMMAGCTATASGTFDVDDMMTQLHATYAGMNSCSGPFDHGQLSMHR